MEPIQNAAWVAVSLAAEPETSRNSGSEECRRKRRRDAETGSPTMVIAARSAVPRPMISAWRR